MGQMSRDYREVLLEALFDELPIAAMAFDADGIIRRWNKRAEEVFGWNAEEAISNHWTMLVPEEIRRSIDETIYQRLASGEIRYSINENLTKDGQTILCFWENKPLIIGGKVVDVL